MSDFKVGDVVYFINSCDMGCLDLIIRKGTLTTIKLVKGHYTLEFYIGGDSCRYEIFKTFEECKTALLGKVNALQEEN